MIVYDPERTVPNWAPGSWQYLEEILPKDAICFEWGGGQSTKWLLDRLPKGRVYTVEHDVKWIDRINELTNYDPASTMIHADKESPAYVVALMRVTMRPNVYLIDGYLRPECLALVREEALLNDIIVCDDALDFADVVEKGDLRYSRYIHKFAMEHPNRGEPYAKTFHRQGMHPDTKETWIWRV